MHEQILQIARNQGELINLNQSRIQVYRDCPRKFYWKFAENLDPDRPQLALEVGSAVHEGLAALGAGQTLDQALAAAGARFERDLPKRRLPGDDEVYAENTELVRRLLVGYEDFWGKKSWQWQPLGNEVSGRVEVGEGSNAFLTFRSDKFVNYGGSLWIVDHKTAAKNDPRDRMKYQMDLQVSAYIYGASKLLKTRVMGVIIDFLIKTKMPQYDRELFERTDEELEEFEADFIRWAHQIRQYKQDMLKYPDKPWRAFPKNDKECFRYGTCPFRGLCLDPSNEALRMQFVHRKEDYVDNPVLLSAGSTPGNAG